MSWERTSPTEKLAEEGRGNFTGKLVILDLDDCLIDTWGALVPTLVKQAVRSMVQAGLQIDSFDSAVLALEKINQRSRNGEEAVLQFLEQIGADKKHLEAGKKGFYDFNFDYDIRPLPGVKEMLEKTPADLVLVTKGEQGAQMEKLRKAGLDHKFFRKILVVQNYNKKEYYRQVLEEFGCAPEDCFVCGDRYETDLVPARELGMKTICVLWGRGKNFPPKKEEVDFIIEDLAEIVPIVKSSIVYLRQGSLRVGVHQSNLVSISLRGKEFLHGASKPEPERKAEDRKGWDKSEIVMFPIIGPIKNFKLEYGSQVISQDQHGLARNLPWKIAERKQDYLRLEQKYAAGSLVPNAKFVPGGERPQFLDWPFSYRLEKEIILDGEKVRVNFKVANLSREKMPYQLGWHPAFKVRSGFFEVQNKNKESQKFTLQEVIDASRQMALFLPEADLISYLNQEGVGVRVTSEGFGKAMLWCPGEEAGMCCIEPVTHLPVPEESGNYLNSPSVELLDPGGQKEYSIVIEPWEKKHKVCVLAAGSGTRMKEFCRTVKNRADGPPVTDGWHARFARRQPLFEHPEIPQIDMWLAELTNIQRKVEFHDFNKALLPIQGKPAIGHILEKFPPEVEVVIAVGYKKETVIDYLTWAYPQRSLTFVEVDKFEGPGTGPGYSLLQCRNHLQCPFIFFAVDTLVREEIPEPTENWFGLAEVPDTSRFCSAKVEGDLITRIDDKVKCENRYAFIGLAGVKDYDIFWKGLEGNNQLIGGEVQVSRGFVSLMEKGMRAKFFTWFDTGVPESYRHALENYPDGEGYNQLSEAKTVKAFKEVKEGSCFKSLASMYFEAFSRKDVSGLAEMFDPSCSLKDWEIEVTGKEEVLQANQKIFDSVETIKAEPLHLFQEESQVIAELLVTINGKEKLKVVDVLEFTPAGKIKRVRAYKG